MTAAGLIFANIHDDSLSELTMLRTIASIPYGGRYRLIDFALSNMVNAGMDNVGIITHYNYRSLLDHIGSGSDWDLARRSGGISILPPFITARDVRNEGRLVSTRLEALLGVRDFIYSRCREDNIVLSDSDVICNIDISDVLAAHERMNSDVTIVIKHYDSYDGGTAKHWSVDTCGDEVTDIYEYKPEEGRGGDISLNIIVVNRRFLLRQLDEASIHSGSSFFQDVLAKNIGRAAINAYRFSGHFGIVNSLEGYYRCSMDLLDPDPRRELLGQKERPIFTKVRNSAPTAYRAGADVKNSLIADGCVIEGHVENSIIFRGVHIGRDTVVRNSVLMQDTYIGNDVSLDCVISDKSSTVVDGVTLSGHSSMPFFIGKGVMVR